MAKEINEGKSEDEREDLSRYYVVEQKFPGVPTDPYPQHANIKFFPGTVIALQTDSSLDERKAGPGIPDVIDLHTCNVYNLVSKEFPLGCEDVDGAILKEDEPLSIRKATKNEVEEARKHSGDRNIKGNISQ